MYIYRLTVGRRVVAFWCAYTALEARWVHREITGRRLPAGLRAARWLPFGGPRITEVDERRYAAYHRWELRRDLTFLSGFSCPCAAHDRAREALVGARARR